MQGNKNIMVYIKDLLERYDKTQSWLADKAGLDSSVFRKWKYGQKPSDYSLNQIRKVIKEYMSDELPLFEAAVRELDYSSPTSSSGELTDQIKDLETIVDARTDIDAVQKTKLKEDAARFLVKYNYEFARKMAQETKFCTGCEDECEEFTDTPKFVKLEQTSIVTKTYKLVEGFFLDVVPLPDESYSDIIHMYLWNKDTPFHKIFVGAFNKLEMEEKYGSTENAIMDYINGDEFIGEIINYFAPFLEEEEIEE